MSVYRYEAACADGALVSGLLDSPSAGQASAELAERGLYPITVVATDADERHPAASRRDLAIAFQSIAALVSAGVPLERAVGASEQVTRGALRETLHEAQTRLREGQSFAQALSASRGVVPGVVLGMIRAGERGSQLDAALAQVATHLEQEADLIARVRQALAYPVVLAVAGTVSIGGSGSARSNPDLAQRLAAVGSLLARGDSRRGERRVGCLRMAAPSGGTEAVGRITPGDAGGRPSAPCARYGPDRAGARQDAAGRDAAPHRARRGARSRR